MPLGLIFTLFRAALPLLLVAGVYYAGWHSRDSSCRQEALGARLALEGASEQVKSEANAHNAELAHAMAESNTKIEQVALENNQLTETLADHNRELLNQRVAADRLRRQAADAGRGCSRMPRPAPAAGGGDEPAAAGTFELSESAGENLVGETERADKFIESLRACRGYVERLKVTFEKNKTIKK